MMPRFTAQYVFHFMEGDTGNKKSYEQLSGSFQHDRDYEEHGSAHDDDAESVAGALLAQYVDDAECAGLRQHLRPGDYVIVVGAGVLHYSTWTDYWSGGTEGDLSVEVEWLFARQMTAYECKEHDEREGFLPSVPLALLTEYSHRNPVVFPSSNILNFGWFRLGGEVITSDIAPPAPAPEKPAKPVKPPKYCAANRDGECGHELCPQHLDGEPAKSRRSCPLPDWPED